MRQNLPLDLMTGPWHGRIFTTEEGAQRKAEWKMYWVQLKLFGREPTMAEVVTAAKTLVRLGVDGVETLTPPPAQPVQ